MNDLLSFSIIVPTYQRHAQLARCLATLARLDYPRERCEVVVVDDGSEPGVDEVVEQFHERLDLKLLAQANAGPAAARNRGARAARGEFLIFTDDDCLPAQDYLRALAARLCAAPAALVGGRTVNALAGNPYSATSQLIIDVVYDYYNGDGAGDDGGARTRDGGARAARFFASNNFAVGAAQFHAAGGFDERFRCSEDRDFCDRWLARGGEMTYAPEAVVQHAHALDAGSLWRQHFGYGRGARRFHRGRAARGGRAFKPDPAFYTRLLSAAVRQPRVSRALALTTLLAWAQAANAAGFFYESLRTARGRES
ncbi:MAG: glycosyltransferase [Pyrinomonadaceae bacterium]